MGSPTAKEIYARRPGDGSLAGDPRAAGVLDPADLEGFADAPRSGDNLVPRTGMAFQVMGTNEARASEAYAAFALDAAPGQISDRVRSDLALLGGLRERVASDAVAVPGVKDWLKRAVAGVFVAMAMLVVLWIVH
jgi:hypothetical protein